MLVCRQISTAARGCRQFASSEPVSYGPLELSSPYLRMIAAFSVFFMLVVFGWVLAGAGLLPDPSLIETAYHSKLGRWATSEHDAHMANVLSTTPGGDMYGADGVSPSAIFRTTVRTTSQAWLGQARPALTLSDPALGPHVPSPFTNLSRASHCRPLLSLASYSSPRLAVSPYTDLDVVLPASSPRRASFLAEGGPWTDLDGVSTSVDDDSLDQLRFIPPCYPTMLSRARLPDAIEDPGSAVDPFLHRTYVDLSTYTPVSDPTQTYTEFPLPLTNFRPWDDSLPDELGHGSDIPVIGDPDRRDSYSDARIVDFNGDSVVDDVPDLNADGSPDDLDGDGSPDTVPRRWVSPVAAPSHSGYASTITVLRYDGDLDPDLPVWGHEHYLQGVGPAQSVPGSETGVEYSLTYTIAQFVRCPLPASAVDPRLAADLCDRYLP